MIFNENEFRELVRQAVWDALPDQEQHQGFADITRFAEISGVDASILESKVLNHDDFKSALYRFVNESEIYIEVSEGLELLKKIMIKVG